MVVDVGRLKGNLIEGRNFAGASAYGCTIKLHGNSEVATSSSKSNAPRWTQSFEFMVADVDKELRLILTKKKFNIGEVVVNLESMKNLDTTRIDKWYPVKSTSHVAVSGEIHLFLEYTPIKPGFRGFDSKAHGEMSDAIQIQLRVNLIRNIQTGAKTQWERMEQAVMEERDFLSEELKRLTKTHGSDSPKSVTVQQMLHTVEQRARELRLPSQGSSSTSSYRLPDLQSILPSSVVTRSESSSPHTTLAQEGNIQLIISDLSSGQKRRQRGSLVVLTDILQSIENKKRFAKEGGADALLILVGSQNEAFVLKALEQLQDLSFREETRRYVNCLGLLNAVVGMLQHENEDMRTLAVCCMTNVALDPDATVQEFFVQGSGKQLFLELLNSSNHYLQSRCLWSLSNMPVEGKKALLAALQTRLLSLFSSQNTDIHIRLARLIINFSTFPDNITALKTEFVPPLISMDSSIDSSVSLFSLQALANLAHNPLFKAELSKPENLANLINFLSSSDEGVQSSTAWLLSNMATDQNCSKLIAEKNGVFLLMKALGNDISVDTKIKVLWALNNISHEPSAKIAINGCRDGIRNLIDLTSSSQGPLQIECLRLLCSIATDNPAGRTVLVENKAVDKLVSLLADPSQPCRGQTCWALIRLMTDNEAAQNRFKELLGFKYLILLLDAKEQNMQQAALWVMCSACKNNQVNCEELGNIKLLYPLLISCLQNESIRQLAVKVISCISKTEAGKQNIIERIVNDVRQGKNLA